MTVFLCRTWWAKRLRQSFMEVNIVLSNPSALLWRRWAVWEWQSFIKITITPLALGFRIHKHTGRLFKLEACGHVCCHLPCPHFKKIKRPTSALSCSVFHHHHSWKTSCKILSRNAKWFTFNFHHYKLILNIHFVFIFFDFLMCQMFYTDFMQTSVWNIYHCIMHCFTYSFFK